MCDAVAATTGPTHPFPLLYHTLWLPHDAVRALAAQITAGVIAAGDEAKLAAGIASLRTGEFKGHSKHADVVRALAAGDLASKSTAARATLGPLVSAASSNPTDPAARLALAEAQLGVGLHADAIENCLIALRVGGPAWNEGAPRRLLLQIFEVLGPQHELTVAGRKALSKLLFR